MQTQRSQPSFWAIITTNQATLDESSPTSNYSHICHLKMYLIEMLSLRVHTVDEYRKTACLGSSVFDDIVHDLSNSTISKAVLLVHNARRTYIIYFFLAS